MDTIFATAIAEKWGNEADVAEAREMSRLTAAACRRDMEEDEQAAAAAAAPRPHRTEEEQQEENEHNAREAAIDA